MIKTVILVLIAMEGVFCGSDLCQNGIRLDSLAYIDTAKMWFFTSGGHYWYIKESEFPPKDPGTPLPQPFTRGDAAIFKNTLDGCKGITPEGGKEQPQEQEIHLIEHVNGKNQVLIFDIRTSQWSTEPQSIESYKDLTQAKIDWTKPIDAAFTHQKTYVVIVQGKLYSVVDIKPLCRNPDNYGDSKKVRPITEFNHQDKIQATASQSDSTFFLFSKDSFWKVSKRYYSSDWRIQGTKGFQQDPGTEFFKYDENCKLPTPPEGEEAEAPDDPAVPVGSGDNAGQPEEGGATEEPAAAETQTEPGDGDDEKGFPWIIVVIIVIIVIILAIVLIACMAMRKKKGDDAEAGMAPGDGAGGSKAGGSKAGGSKAGSSMGTPSTVSSAQSVRSKTNYGSKAGSKMGSKTGSKAAPKTGASSSMGTSPSTMSVRSNPGLSSNSTSKVSKTGSKK